MKTYEEILVTPELAKEMLINNTINYRRLDRNWVRTLAADMKAGNWSDNGTPIVFDDNGLLVDGQHRLNAVIEADTTVKMTICKGATGNVFDLNRRRSLSQQAEALGIVNGNYTTMVALSAFIVGNGDRHKNHGNIVILDYLAAHADDLAKCAAATASGTKSICKKAPVMAAAYCLYRNGQDLNDIANFFKIANTGLPVGYYEPSPALIFRNTLQEFRLQHDAERKMLFCIAVQAIKDFIDGKKRMVKYRGTMEGFNLLNVIRVEDGISEK